MPHKMRAVFLDGSEETMETGDFVEGGKVFSGLVPVAVSYSLDFNDTEHGLYCRIGVHNGGKTVDIKGRAAPTPVFSPVYDVQLLDSAQVTELYEFWWDGACKLRRLGGSLVNLTRLAPTADQSVDSDISDAAEDACELLSVLIGKEGVPSAGEGALDDPRLADLAAKTGWDWKALKPHYVAYSSALRQPEDDGEGDPPPDDSLDD